MSENYHKKKQPEQVRARLLEAAGRRILKDGVQGLRVESVARDAGVSKGGLFHHFPNKAALIEGIFEDGAQQMNQQLEELMAADPVAHGRFSRAYLNACSAEEDRDESAVFFVLTLASSEFKARMVSWMKEWLERHAETDSFPEARIVLHATDGLWMSLLIDEHGQMEEFRESTRSALIAMTYPPGVTPPRG